MLTNYHTHTTRCGHAEGTEEEYILTALRCGCCAGVFFSSCKN